MLFWNPLVMIALMYTAVVTPYRIAFGGSEVKSSMRFFEEFFIDLVFFLDLVVNFCVAYEDHLRNCTVRNPKKIAIRYLKSWFALDFIACLPLQEMLEFYHKFANTNHEEGMKLQSFKITRAARLYRLYRLIRLLRMAKMFRLSVKLINAEMLNFDFSMAYMRLIKIAFILFYSVHFVACIWFFLAEMGDDVRASWIFRHKFTDYKNLE